MRTETAAYQAALDKASAFEQELARLSGQKDSFSQSQIRQLETYIGDDVDAVMYMSMIEEVVTSAGMQLSGLSTTGDVAAPVSTQELPSNSFETEFYDPVLGDGPLLGTNDTQQLNNLVLHTRQFDITASGTYEQFKNFLTDIERSAVATNISDISFSSAESGIFTFQITLDAFGLKSTLPEGGQGDVLSGSVF